MEGLATIRRANAVGFLCMLPVLCVATAWGQQDDGPRVKRAPVTQLPESPQEIDVPLWQDFWILTGKGGARFQASFGKPGEAHWFAFDLADGQVIMLSLFGSTSDQTLRLELFDSDGKDPDPASWSSDMNPFFNGRLKKGRYYVRLTCRKGCEKAGTIEICRYGPTP